MKIKIPTNRLTTLFKREIKIFMHRPLMLFCIIIAPVLCTVFFTSLMQDGLPTNLPAGLVDEDDTQITRTIVRTIDAMQETRFTHRYSTFTEARKAMQRGEIYAFFYIPQGTTEKALASKQPKISFYTNESYLVPGSLLMKDLRTMSEMAGLALTRETLYAKGLTDRQAMGILQPIVIESHPLKNSCLDYSVYLNNILLPGIFILLIMLTTTYTIGMEWKSETQKEWYKLADTSVSTALSGKLLLQTIFFSILFIFCDIYLYKYLHFPCNSGLLPMVGLGILTVLASQAFGIFLFGLFIGQMRLSMCLCSLWGILSFSLAGFTYPVTAMDPILETLACLFPLRHYYLIYVNQALNGFPLIYAWKPIVSLLIFLLLPFTMLYRYRMAFLKYKYKP